MKELKTKVVKKKKGMKIELEGAQANEESNKQRRGNIKSEGNGRSGHTKHFA